MKRQFHGAKPRSAVKLWGLFLTLLLLFAPLLSAQEEKRPMDFTDVVSLKRVSSPRLSPDGKQMIFTVSEADWEKNKYISHIWRIDTDGTGLIQMTHSEEGEGGGYWSPDGRYIAFISKRDEKPQIHLLRNSGGEAFPLTQSEGGVNDMEWAPDSQTIFYTATNPLTEEEKRKKKEKDDAIIFEHDYKHSHLWRIDVESKEAKRITSGDFTVQSFNLSRDGSKIVYSKAPTPLYDDVLNAEIYIRDVNDKEGTRITNNHIYETSIELSPDNQKILFVADANQDFENYYQSTLFLVPAQGGTPELILPNFQYEIYSATWSADGSHIYFTANMGVHSEIFSLELETKEVNQLTNGDQVIYGFDYKPQINTVAFEKSTPQNPGTLWTASMKPFKPQKVHNPYTELQKFKLASYEAIQWESTDGKMVEGILIYPIGYEEGKRYPLLVHTHGGPMSSDKMNFEGYDHARAGRGYAILKPNYRGSTGYGNEVLRDMVGHYFHHADDDVLTGVDYLVEKGIADPEQTGTLGWSAGGHMTNWLVTQTDRFKAASSGAGASNWISMYAQSDVRIYRTPWFGGDPWHEDSPLEAYRNHSPIFHVHKATTPTLILVGENDQRVPMPQSVEMYRGLKANGVPTELVVFPRSGHGPRELRHRLYKMNKEFHWLEKYIRGKDFQYDQPPETEEEEKQ
ncbi:S9 family peptidase [bacterium]|nr:S9 family peptidase [bacterium]